MNKLMRSWITWVGVVVILVAMAIGILSWHPIQPRKHVGDTLVVNGQVIALPLKRCGFDGFQDGGSRVMPCEDRNGEIHVFVCRWPGYREMLHQHLGKVQFTGSLDHYGTVVVDDEDVRNLLYWTLADSARQAGISFPGIKDLYPSLYQRWFADWF